jgi:CRISPR system Cascade subunit CasC
MKIELHILQNFAPSCLNRDDTNSPKDCTFGGVRRARISSQSLKRSIRLHPRFKDGVSSRVGIRTKLLADEIASGLVTAGRAPDVAGQVVERALQEGGYKVDATTRKTSVLLYLSPGELDAYTAVLEEHFDELEAAVAAGKKGKVSSDLKKKLKDLGSSTTEAADIALFGRMVAENKNMNVDAACQVAHAISTHGVRVEMDFFTAVDDLQPKEDQGAGMMGVVEFNSACFYRYALLDFDQLVGNLRGDRESAREAATAFVGAAIEAIPSGRQNSMAAHNPPSYIRLRVRDQGMPWSLANAFAAPVRPKRGSEDLPCASAESLEQYDDSLKAMYGKDGIVLDSASSTFDGLGDQTVAGLLKQLTGALS